MSWTSHSASIAKKLPTFSSLWICSVLASCLAACGGTQAGAPPASDPGPGSTPTSGAAPRPSDTDGSQRTSITAEACEAEGGTVVGDIGDGAIHRPDYRCPSGEAPLGSISAPDSGPIGVEGAVCCPG